MSKTFTPAEVAQHNTEKDCWIIFKGKVYDVTEYLDDHPGGVEIVTDLAGMDSTEDFEDVGHSEEAYAMLDKYLLGSVTDGSVAVSASVVAPAPARAEEPVKVQVNVAAPSAPPAATEPPQKHQQHQQPQRANDDSGNSTMLMVGGAVAVAGLAWFLLRKKK